MLNAAFASAILGIVGWCTARHAGWAVGRRPFGAAILGVSMAWVSNSFACMCHGRAAVGDPAWRNATA